MEPKFECMDCHEGDEAYAQYNFEHIYEEYHESVHASKHDEEFTCWMCHDPHSYKINARSNIPLKEVIVYDNSICLSCHADINKYQLISALANPNVLQTHEWLPNQSLHFRNVRCIECHSEIDESILVAHKILPKEEAVRLCVDCHSSNSILMATLYKYQAKERRNQIGFFNAAILSESFVIGANRNYFLSLSSVIIFIIIIAGIAIHITFRIITRKTN
jgi:hypothetical protein